jgi:hypothetical protein
MAKVTRISAEKEDIELLAVSVLQLAAHERLEITGQPLESLKQRIYERKEKIGDRDLHLLAREVEKQLISEAIHTCGTSCCFNCTRQYECDEFQALVGEDSTESNVHERDAVTNCEGYVPDRSVFDQLSEKVPAALLQVEVYGVPVNKARTLEKVLAVAGGWMLELQKTGKSLPIQF